MKRDCEQTDFLYSRFWGKKLMCPLSEFSRWLCTWFWELLDLSCSILVWIIAHYVYYPFWKRVSGRIEIERHLNVEVNMIQFKEENLCSLAIFTVLSKGRVFFVMNTDVAVHRCAVERVLLKWTNGQLFSYSIQFLKKSFCLWLYVMNIPEIGKARRGDYV